MSSPLITLLSNLIVFWYVRMPGVCDVRVIAFGRALLMDHIVCDGCAYCVVFIELGGVVMRN